MGQGIEHLLKDKKRIALDTMVFIYHFENNPQYNKITSWILKQIEIGEITGVTSTLTLLEILVKPLQLFKNDVVENYQFALTNFPNLTLSPLSTSIARKAAELRAKYNLHTPDSIQIATAIIEKTDLFLTNDNSLTKVDEIQVLTIDEIENSD